MTATLSQDSPVRFQLATADHLGRPVADVPGAARPRSRAPRRAPRQARPRLLRAVPARRHLGRGPRPSDVLLGAGPDGQLRRTRTHRAGRQPADGHAGPAGAHRVPQAGVPRLHTAPGRGGRTQGPRVRRRAHRAASRANGGGDIVAELFKPLPSMVVAHYLGVPEADRGKFDGWTDAIVAANTAEGGIGGALETLGDALGEMMAYFTALIERRRVEPEDDTVSHLVAAGVGADGDIAGRAVDPGVHLHHGHRRQRHHHRHAGRLGAVAAPASRPAAAAGRATRADPRRRRRVPAADLAGTDAGPHRNPRCHDRRRHDPRGPPGDVPLRVGQPRRTPVRRRRRRTRRHPQAAQHPDLQPWRAPLPGRRRRPDAVPGGADRIAGARSGFRGRRVRDHLGRRQLRASAAVGTVPGAA